MRYRAPKDCSIGLPVLLIEPCLKLIVLAHQDKVADQVGLSQVEACRIQALEDHLRVILPASEANVDGYELLNAPINEVEVDVVELFVEKLQILEDSLGRGGGILLLGIDDCCHGLLVRTPQKQLVALGAFAVGVAQVIVFKLKTGGQTVVIDWIFRLRLFSRQPVSERCQQKRNGREPLLTVDQEPARDLGSAPLRRYIDDRADKMSLRVGV